MKKLLPFAALSLMLTVTSCGGGGGTTPPVTEVVGVENKVKGSLANWPYAAALLKVELPFNDLQPGPDYAIASNGTVGMDLPKLTAPLQHSYLSGCTLSPDFQGGNVNFDVGRLLVYSKGQDYLGQIVEVNGDNLILRFYASASTTLVGKATCGSDVLKFNAQLKQGWNALQVSQTGDGNYNLVDLPATAKPSLEFLKADERVVIQPANPAPLKIKRGETVDYPVTIFQDGGISGDITLSTNVNGLEFSPRKITLPGTVGMQSLNKSSHYLLRKVQLGGTHGGQQLQSQSLSTTLKLTAHDYVVGYKGGLLINAQRANGEIVGSYTHADVEVLVPQLSADISPVVAPQGKTTNWTFTIYPQDYRGPVTVSLEGLPGGLNVPGKTVQFTDKTSQQVSFALAPDSVAVGHYPVTLTMKQETDGFVTQKPTVLTVMPKPLPLVEASSAMTASADGNLWYTSSRGVIRQRPDGSYDAFSDPGYRCGDLMLGGDGGIWETSQPLVRFDPVTGSARLVSDPRGRSGCGGSSGFYIDSQGRGWERYTGIQRLDYTNQKADTVAGSENDSLLDVEKTQVWASAYVHGQQQLVRIDANTLAREVKPVAGINTFFPAYARGGKLWLPKSVPYRLAVYDPAKGAVNQFDVKIDGQVVTSFEVLGVDAQGRHWLEITTSANERTFSDWVLYDPMTQTAVKRSPAIFAMGSGQLKGVAPDGTLWVRTTDPQTAETAAYVIKP